MVLNWINELLNDREPVNLLDYSSDCYLGYDGALRPDVIGFITEHSNCGHASDLITHDIALDEHELALG